MLGLKLIHVNKRGPRCAGSLHWNDNALRWRHNERDCVSNHQPHYCLLKRLFGRRSKKTSKLRVTGLCEGNSPETGEFPAQRASNAENVSIWWRHHGFWMKLSALFEYATRALQQEHVHRFYIYCLRKVLGIYNISLTIPSCTLSIRETLQTCFGNTKKRLVLQLRILIHTYMAVTLLYTCHKWMTWLNLDMRETVLEDLLDIEISVTSNSLFGLYLVITHTHDNHFSFEVIKSYSHTAFLV